MLQQIKTIKIIFSFLMIPAMVFCFGNCGARQNNQAAKLQHDIMSIHDSVMPKMGYVLKLRSTISELMESTVSGAARDSMQQASFQLTKADKEMMEWMHQYNDPGTESDTAMQYLEEQHIKIAALAVNIRSAIAQGETMVEQYSEK